MSRAVDLILPDAGPLISLAHADRLDLLELFSVPVIVLDVVGLECLRKPEAPDHDRLAAWFDSGSDRITVAQTPLVSVYRQALDAERSGADPVATRGLGDAALTWALSNVDRLARPGALPLVLVEDRRLAVRLQALNQGHVLSTRTWLAALDDAGLADYRAIVAAMARHGRNLSSLAIDAPVRAGDDATSWLDILSPDDPAQ